MTSNYEVFFYDTSGTLQLLLDGWKRLEFHQRINQPWNAILRQNFSYPDDRLSFFREDLTRDWMMEVYRRDAYTGSRNLVYEGFHRTLVDQVLSTGTVELTLYSSGYTSLLGRRLVVPPAGQEKSIKSGAAETIMKAYVDDQAVSATDTDRNFSGLSIEADGGAGNTAAYEARYTILNTVIDNIAKQGEVDYGIVGTGTLGQFEFQVRDEWGIDRQVGNSAGNVPATFDLFMGNMEIPILALNGGDEVTLAYVGGQGQGINRTILEVENTAAIANSPWSRIETFVDARKESTSDGLTTRGQAILDKRAFRENFTFNIEQTAGSRWIENYGLGDTVTARYFEHSFTMKIVEIVVVVVAGSGSQIELINAELENVS